MFYDMFALLSTQVYEGRKRMRQSTYLRIDLRSIKKKKKKVWHFKRAQDVGREVKRLEIVIPPK